MTVAIARDIAEYLQILGLGTLNTTIFIDSSPDTPDDIITVYDKGGRIPENPDNWRNIYIEVRSGVHQNGFDRVWNIFNNLLYPAAGYIQAGVNTYLSEFQSIPSVDDLDLKNRYLFGFKVAARRVVTGGAADSWLQALAQWTESVLPGWYIYRVLSGNKRPAVTWQITGVKVEQMSRAAYKVSKVFTAGVQGNTPEEMLSGATCIVEELGNVVKVPLDLTGKRYLTVSNPVADLKADNLTAGQVSVTLARTTNKPVAEMPLMASVRVTQNN